MCTDAHHAERFDEQRVLLQLRYSIQNMVTHQGILLLYQTTFASCVVLKQRIHSAYISNLDKPKKCVLSHLKNAVCFLTNFFFNRHGPCA